MSKIVILTAICLIFCHCFKWDESKVKIERFEYLDDYYRESYKNDSISAEAYLIHGYNSRHEDKIHEITDRYMCDSIMPNHTLHRDKFFTFYKKSKNTNRENFQERPKHKAIRARSNDKLFSYIFVVKDSVTFISSKYFYGLDEPDPPPQDFHCD